MSVIDVAVGVVRDHAGRILIAKRKDDVHQGGLWEFPGGKFEHSEDEQQALSRELYEELNIRPKSTSPLIKINFNYPECRVHLHVREVHDFEGELVGREGQVCRWVTIQELNTYVFPEANKAILSAIKLGRYYAIVGGDDSLQVLRELESISKQGVRMVQVRTKGLSEQASGKILEVIRLKCKALKIHYLLNSQMPVKRNLDEGVHLTSVDLMDLSQRPDCLGVVGASCHNLHELRKAESLALDFAVLSPVMDTVSHPGASVLGWQQFKAMVAEINIPVFALGGMAKHDYKMAIECGAQGISGISMFNLGN